MTSDRIRCYLQQYREEIIKNGLENLPPEIRDAVIDELFGPEKTAQNGEIGNIRGALFVIPNVGLKYFPRADHT
jgi:hypothetical protein